MNTNSMNKSTPTEMFIGKYDEGCTGYHKQGSSHRNFGRNNSGKQDTSRAPSHQVLDTHWCPISFTLVVDNFGVKYIDDTHVHHLIKTLKVDYEIDEDWEGTRYLGLAIDWDYTKREVHLTMPGYVNTALARFNHKAPTKPQH